MLVSVMVSDHERECLLRQGHTVLCVVRGGKNGRLMHDTSEALFPKHRHVLSGSFCYDSPRWEDPETSFLAAPTEEMARAVLDKMGVEYDLIPLTPPHRQSPA